MATPIEEALVLKPTLPTTIVYDVSEIQPPFFSPNYLHEVAYIWDVYSNSFGIWIAINDEGLNWKWRDGRRAGTTSQATIIPYGKGEVYHNLTSNTIHQSIDGSTWIQLG